MIVEEGCSDQEWIEKFTFDQSSRRTLRGKGTAPRREANAYNNSPNGSHQPQERTEEHDKPDGYSNGLWRVNE